MALGAYAQIESLSSIAEANGISCPRLRGYRLMRDEKCLNPEDFKHQVELDVLRELVETGWGNVHWYTLGAETDAKCRHYIKNYDCWYMPDNDPEYKEPEVRWDRINGKKKRILVTRVKNIMRDIRKQCEVWNRYVGRDDILYIHARIGGGNWPCYYTYVVDQPWFLEKVDNWIGDSTYCDIFAKIAPFTGELRDDDEEE